MTISDDENDTAGCVARAGGKVILLGEHAVVYGAPALAVGLARGARARAALAARSSLHLEGAPANEGERLRAALAAQLELLRAPAMRVDVALELPAGAGLGASAALGVACARAILGAASDAPPTLEQVLAAAQAWEQVFHGAPSGVDAAASALGGCIYFTRGVPPRRLRLARPLSIAVARAAPPASTQTVVARVRDALERAPGPTRRLIDDIADLAARAEAQLTSGDLVAVGGAMSRSHELLAALGVSTPELDRARALALRAGALGAKLTGSGGGGCVVALVEDPAQVLSAWRGAALEAFAFHCAPEPPAAGPSWEASA